MLAEDAKNGCGAKFGGWEAEPKMDAVCCRRDQKWMLEPELDALREEGLNNTTKGRRLPRNELAQTAGFSGIDAFRVKAAET